MGLPPPDVRGNPVLLEGGPQKLCFREESSIPVRPKVEGSVSAASVGARPQIDREALPRGQRACPTGGGHSVEPSVTPAGPRARSGQGRLPGGGGSLTSPRPSRMGRGRRWEGDGAGGKLGSWGSKWACAGRWGGGCTLPGGREQGGLQGTMEEVVGAETPLRHQPPLPGKSSLSTREVFPSRATEGTLQEELPAS